MKLGGWCCVSVLFPTVYLVNVLLIICRILTKAANYMPCFMCNSTYNYNVLPVSSKMSHLINQLFVQAHSRSQAQLM